MTPVTLIAGADLPDLAITWKDRDGTVINFATGWTFTVKVGPEGGAASITKTTNITGASTAPNVTIAWATTEVGTLAAGRYVIEVTALQSADSRERKRSIPLLITKALS